MNIFNIIGPRMIGPSSSHTAGAVRLGNVANKIMHGAKPIKADIEISGSFKATYKGHGTDKALIAGILGYKSDDEEIKDIFEIAKQAGLEYKFIPVDIPDSHPNTARINFECEDGLTGTVQGASIGGGNIRIDSINGLKVSLTAENTTLLVIHNDKPGVIANVTNLMNRKYTDANICNFSLNRDRKGGIAMMSIELDNPPSNDIKYELESLEDVINVVIIEAI